MRPQLIKLLSHRCIKELIKDVRLLEIQEKDDTILIIADYVPVAEISIKDFHLEKKIAVSDEQLEKANSCDRKNKKLHERD